MKTGHGPGQIQVHSTSAMQPGHGKPSSPGVIALPPRSFEASQDQEEGGEEQKALYG